MKEGELEKKYRLAFSGGVNYFLGVRQVKDNESPASINCDFKGANGVGNRLGYTQIGAVADSRTVVYGMSQFKTSTYNQAIKFVSNASNVALYHGTGGAWTSYTTTTFTDALPIYARQAGSKLYMSNGTDVMRDWDGAAIAATTNGTKGFYTTYYDKRLWVVDEVNSDTLNFSGQYAVAGSKLGDFVDASAGTITIEPGSGVAITGMISYKNKLYVFLTNAIYRLYPATAANTFTVELVTKSVGCVSHRSIDQVGEDVFFCADDGVYSLGDVANYLDVRTANKSAKIQTVFDGLSATNKTLVVGKYFNFKYHLFYSLYGTSNDSCAVWDVRYQGWQDWRNIAGAAAVVYTDSASARHLYFGEPTTGKVNELYSGTTDAGTAIDSYWYSKSYDEAIADTTKLYFDTTAVFGALNGTVTLSVIFNDSEISSAVSLTQQNPQGGFGSYPFGRQPFGKATNNITVTQVINQPYRLRAKGQKFAIQYKVENTGGSWRLDSISQTFIPFSHYKFLASNKLN